MSARDGVRSPVYSAYASVVSWLWLVTFWNWMMKPGLAPDTRTGPSTRLDNTSTQGLGHTAVKMGAQCRERDDRENA